MTIGERIKQRRLKLGLSVDQLADMIGKNRATVYRYEGGDIERFPIDTLYPLAQALHVTPGYLMGWENENTQECLNAIKGNYEIPDQDPQDIKTIVDIKGRRIDRGLSIEEAANAVGVSPETLADWEDHGIKGITTLQMHKLAGMIGLSIMYFQDPLDLREADPTTIIKRPEMVRIPILEGVTVHNPLYSPKHVAGHTCTDLQSGAEFFALIAPDDSMSAARIQKGDMVICRRQSYIETGKIAVVLVDDRPAVIRRYYRTGDVVTLIPQAVGENTEPETIDLNTTAFRIIGQVVRDTFDFEL